MKNKNKKGGRLRLIWRFLKGSRGYFAASMVFAAVLSLLELINPKVIAFTVDSVLGDKIPEKGGFAERISAFFGGAEFLRENLWMIAAAIAAVSLAALLFRYLFRLFNSMGAETLVMKMREDLFSHIQRLPFEWHDKNKTGDIIQRCTSDVETVKQFLSEQLTSVFRIVILLTMSMIFMFGMNVTLSLIALFFIPVIVGYSAFFHKRISKHFKECDEADGLLSAITQDNLTGIRVVRAFGREDLEREKFKKQSGILADLWIHLSKLFSLFWGVGDMISGLQVMLIIVVGSVICVRGDMTAGDLIAFISYNAMLVWPVRQLGRVISQMSRAGVAADRIAYIMDSPTERDKDETKSGDMSGDVVFDNVSFSYGDKNRMILENVSFTVKGGTTFGILGGTGSGKSTLISLLDRLYELPPENGRITVGGVDIADMKASDVRRGIGIVMQEPFLFSRTIAENIAMAKNGAEEYDIREAAKTACLDETVSGFTKGYGTTVGERGVTLSGGQKQRTAIARMLISETPIMIFDDALSAVDAETDAKIRAALREKTKKSTVILISHRISTLMHADRILVLDKGKVSEIGTHEELLKSGGIYRRIYDIQTSSKEVTE